MPTRRSLLAAGGRLALAGVLAGCGLRDVALPGSGRRGAAASLRARPPQRPGGRFPEPGTRPLGLRSTRDVLLYVPPGLDPAVPPPLVVTLHGAGGDAPAGLDLLRGPADRHGLVLLAPASRGPTWDAVLEDYGPDAELVDQALGTVFAGCPVDGERVAVAGFSDGASYALGLGLANGGLLHRVVAFSPGFVPPAPASEERPAVFLSHGDADDVLPIERTGRRTARSLRDDGYDVTYGEFSGGHVVPAEVAEEAVVWLGWTGGG